MAKDEAVTIEKAESEYKQRREQRLDDIMRFAGLAENELGMASMVRSMLRLAYESGYLHGHRDVSSRVLDIVRKSYQ